MPESLRDLVEMISSIEDRQERIELLMSLADRYERPSPEQVQAPHPTDRQVPQCESEVYVYEEPLESGGLKWCFAVENPQGISAMAMSVILDDALSGADPERILAIPPDVVYDIFGRELSMGKGLGLMGMVQLVQALTKRRLAAGEVQPKGS